MKRSHPVKAIPFGRLVLQVRGPDRIGAFQSASMKTKKHIQSRHGPKASRQSKSKKQPWKVIHPHAAGIDIGATEHYVAVPPDAVPAGASNVRKFGCFTEDLDALVEWLKACGVDTVAMQSTGVYWIVPFQKLEVAGIKPVLVNAQMLKLVPGRKTDVQECQWIQQLHTYGLLAASFRPTDATCRLRTLVRHRANLVSSGAEHILHMQKALTQMNIQLHQVVSHLTGETGLRILKAILKGERDPYKLVELRDAQITRSTKAEMIKALRGDWRAELLFVLEQSLKAWEFDQEQMRACDLQIEGQLKQMPSAPRAPAKEAPSAPDPLARSKPRPKAKQSRKRNDPEKDLGPELARIGGTDLAAAHGLRLLTVLTILSETGVDMSKWRSAKAFTSWLGLNPNNKISGGRILSSRTRKVVNRVATALRLGAMGVAETETWLGSFHRRMRARLGPAGANTATARKIGTVVYHLLKTKEPFIDRDLLAYEARVYRHKLSRLKKQAKALGYELIQTSQQQTVVE
ncbi:MAG TPA: IS110 family transposase [Verrucomicrobiae bacterium]